MIKNKDFEIVSVADEHMAVPVGEEAASFHGVITLNEAAAFLLNKMEQSYTIEQLIQILQEEYDVDSVTAEKDINELLNKLIEMKLVIDD